MSNNDPEMEVAVLSEKGLRDENQDWMSWSQVPWGECCIVADGMGGHKGGALAARMTVEGLERHLGGLPSDWSFEKALQEAILRTNEEIYRSAHSGDSETENMGSTVVIALVSGGQVQVGHIGDSRAYLFRKGRLKPLTEDHTGVQRMVAAGMISAVEARAHPDAHILNRAVGSKPEVEIEISKPILLEEGDGILLCSDGLNGYLDDEQIEKTVRRRQSDVQRIPQELVELALRSGGDDNITVQYIRYGSAGRSGKTVTQRQRQTVKLSMFQRPDRTAAVREFARQLPKSKPAWAVAFAALIVVAIIPTIKHYQTGKSQGNPVASTVKPADPAAVASAQKDSSTPPAETGQSPSIVPGSATKSPEPVSVASSQTSSSAPPADTKPSPETQGATAAVKPATPAPAANSRAKAPKTLAKSKQTSNNRSNQQGSIPESTGAVQPPAPARAKTPVIILLRSEGDRALADKVKDLIQQQFSGDFELLPPEVSNNISLLPETGFIYYSDDALEEGVKRLSEVLKTVPELEKIDEHRGPYHSGRKLLQELGTKLAGEKHLLIIPPVLVERDN